MSIEKKDGESNMSQEFNFEGGILNDELSTFNLETSGEINDTDLVTHTPTNGPYLPRSTFGYTESETLLGNNGPVNVTYTMPSTPTEDYQLEMWDTLNEFEFESWSSAQMGFKTGMPKIDEAFDGGLKPGFIVIAADSNIGKTALLSQIAWNVAELNERAYVMDISLDDPLPDKLSRVVGCQGRVIINAVKNPKGYLEYPLMLARRAQSINRLRERVDRYRAYDASKLSTHIEEIEAEVIKMQIKLEAEGNGRQLVIFIDNLHDLTIREKPNLLQKDRYDEIAQWAADLAIRLKCPIVCTAEFKKINGTRRGEIDDIRECVKIKYEAKAVLLIYNEVHYKGEAAEIYFKRHGYHLKQPILEIHFAKNKISSFKGRLFYEFYPELSRLEQPDEDGIKHYAGLVYS